MPQMLLIKLNLLNLDHFFKNKPHLHVSNVMQAVCANLEQGTACRPVKTEQVQKSSKQYSVDFDVRGQ